MNDCSFCNEFSGDESNNFFDIYLKNECGKLKIASRIIAQTKHFNILPMIGPLVPGYLLIVPKDHYLSFAHLSVELLKEAKLICWELRRIFSTHYTVPLIFEHGPMGATKKSGCCTDHAHLHIVAVHCDIKDRFSPFGYQLRKINDVLEVRKQADRKMPYLYYENQKNECFVADAPIVESQFIRKVIAITIGAEDRVYWFDTLQIPWVIDIIQKMRPIFSELRLKGESIWR